MITSVLLENIGYWQRFELTPGPVTIIRGANGTGKSSIINAIRNIAEGGNDPDLIRIGSDESRTTITFADGTKFVKTMNRDPEKGYDLKGFGPNGETLRSPKTKLNALIDEISLDPEALNRVDAKKRTEILLKALDISFTPQELATIFRGDQKYKGVREAIDLIKFDELAEGTRDRRAEVNRAERDLQGTIATMQKSLPDDDDKDWTAARKQKQAELASTRETIATREAETQAALADAVSAIKSSAEERIAKIRAELADAIEVRQEQAAKILSEETQALRESERDLIAEVARLEGLAKQQQQAEGVRKAIQEQEDRRQSLLTSQRELDAVVKRASEARAKKLEALPIEGLEIKGREIYIGGIHWDKLNTAQRRGLAMQLANLHDGSEKIRVVDDAGDFDPENQAALIEWAKSASVQLIIAEPSSGDLSIEVSE